MNLLMESKHMESSKKLKEDGSMGLRIPKEESMGESDLWVLNYSKTETISSGVLSYSRVNMDNVSILYISS